MTATAKALNAFFSSFGLPAWPEEAVPEDSALPYITYTVTEPDWRMAAILTARVWHRGAGFEALHAKVGEILRRIGEGVKVPAGSGWICIRPGSPLAQRMPMPGDPDLKVVYINLQLNSYHMQGE